jgi:cholesterol oxidase
MDLQRRRFLAGAAAGAATIATGRTSPALAAGGLPRRVAEERRRAVVVGTGFGGAITALRLARAGVDVLVLERGIRWPVAPGSNTFPRLFHQDRRASWLTPGPVFTGSLPAVWRPYTGVLERVHGVGMDVLCGAGVGGGSLVYHGMTIQPTEAAFTASMPAALDYRAFDTDYYPRVSAVLRPTPIPDDILGHPRYRAARQFHNRVVAAGLTPYRVPLPIDWDVVRRELRGELPPSYSTGDIILGANNGGKRTVDVTYLAAAEATGRAEVAELHVVRDIARDPQGRWEVQADRINTDGHVQESKRIIADALFLAAGSAGTTRLLVKAKAKGLIPGLPDGVGGHWGNNGDRIFTWTPLGESPGPLQGGPACIALRDNSTPDDPLLLIHGPVPFPIDLGTTTVNGLGIVEPRGRFVYDALHDDAVLHWSPTYDAALALRIAARLRQVLGGGIVGGVRNPLLDTTLFDPTTYHPLGGATIGPVCDPYGRVLDQRGLYVNDSALIPGSTGATNPSLTIAALAERNMDQIVAQDVGTVF